MGSSPTFYEFFAGAGLARVGLAEAGFECLWANDIDPKKIDVYRSNFGTGEITIGDIANVTGGLVLTRGRADLAWASFPCQDLSIAGKRKGIHHPGRTTSSTFWEFHRVLKELRSLSALPTITVIENVPGLLDSGGGADFKALLGAMIGLGYEIGALLLDAADFVPQSRPRVFIVCLAPDRVLALAKDGLPAHETTVADPALQNVYAGLPMRIKNAWRWWSLPPSATARLSLASCLATGGLEAAGHQWHTAQQTDALLMAMSESQVAQLAFQKAIATTTERWVFGVGYRRTRRDGVRFEARWDGLAGCLRVPSGGSSKQIVVRVEPDLAVRTRLLTGREAARLMGVGEWYRLPKNETDALAAMGDAVCAPVVGHLARHLLVPLLSRGV